MKLFVKTEDLNHEENEIVRSGDRGTIQNMIIIPEVFLPPDWVQKNMTQFKVKVKESYRKNDALVSKDVKEYLEKYILLGKIKPVYPLHKKNTLKLMNQIFDVLDDKEFKWVYYLLGRAAFFLSTFSPSSFTPEVLTLPPMFVKRKEKVLEDYLIRKDKAGDNADLILKNLVQVDEEFDKLSNDVMQHMRENDDLYPVIHLIDSGAKGGSADIRKLLIGVGLSINSAGEVNDVITKSHLEGLTQTQFYNYSSQAITSLYAKSSDTAVPGYLIRKLNTMMSGVVLSDNEDCGTTKTMNFKILNKEMLLSLDGKSYIGRLGLNSIDAEKDQDLIGKIVKIRSSLYCEDVNGICKTCYNKKFIKLMRIPSGGKIGLLASTGSASLLTALTLKKSHTGSNLSVKYVDLEKDIKIYSQ